MNKTPLNSADVWDSLDKRTRDIIYDKLIEVSIDAFLSAGAKVSNMPPNHPAKPLAEKLYNETIHCLGSGLKQIEEDRENGLNPLPYLGFEIVDGAVVPVSSLPAYSNLPVEDVIIAMRKAGI